MVPVVTFIVHGLTSRKPKLYRLIDKVFGNDFELKVKQTTEIYPADLLATEALAEGTDYLIAVGGDGTVNEVVNAYLDSEPQKEVPIGIFPQGRGNDFVKSMGIQKSLKSLFLAIQNKQVKSVDVGYLTFFGPDQKELNRYFINIADIGIGGLATQMIRISPKFLGPNITYFWAIIKSLISYKSQMVKISTPDWFYEGEVLSVSMANGKYFGSGLCIAPDAEVDDGISEIVLIGNVGIWDYLAKIPHLKKGKKINHPEVSYKQARSCTITSKNPMPIDMDGEFVGFTPLEMMILPKKVKILV